MYAAIDAGSNTLRMLVASVEHGTVVPQCYFRRICRLAGNMSQGSNLDHDSKSRAMSVFTEFSEYCQASGIQTVKAIGTAAFRIAGNGQSFAEDVSHQTGLKVDIIDGIKEARLTTSGVLSAIKPVPKHALIIDIGGGSTEFALVSGGNLVWAESFSLGVVRLSEACNDHDRHAEIERTVNAVARIISERCQHHKITKDQLTLIGTAGTATTLAALDMQMNDYDWRRVNNYSLGLESLARWHDQLAPLTPTEREALPGMEAGRGDLIVAGLEVILSLVRMLATKEFVVSDFGLLEGLVLSMAKDAYS